MRGVGLSHERLNVAEAECVPVHEGSMCAVVMQDGDASPGSKATTRMKGNHRNMRGPTGAAGLVSGGGGRRGLSEAVIRAEDGSRTGS